ncbi:hypothetical protein BGZ98_001766 [Dissophora globulifera]|nr:hypothetical protein BGZ98_001766 [Dissophora globulifera]
MAEVPTPTSATPSILKGGADMVASGSSTSLTSSVFLNPMSQQRPASPAPSQGGGPFRTLSSRLAASTLRKLSVSQKSLFSSSREDLLSGSSNNNGGWAGCSHCQQESGSVQDSMTEAEGGAVDAGTGCCRCCCGAQEGSVCSESGDPTNTTAMEAGSGSNCGRKAQRVQSKLRGLRGVSGSKHGHSKDKDKDKDKDKSRKASRKSRETDQSNPSQPVNQEFAHYNYERQIEDFQRAARIFKEQKAITAAAAAASMTAEVRAITRAASTKLSSADTGKGRKAQGQQQQQTLQQSTNKSFASSSASVAITPIQEVEGESSPSLVASAPIHPFSITNTSANSCKNSTDSLHNTADSSPDGNIRGRKKSIASSTRSGLLRPISRSHRRVGSSASTGASRGASAKDAAIAIVSTAEQIPRKSYSCNNIDKSGRGNGTPFGLDDDSYTSIGYGSKIFDPFTTTEGTEINGDVLALNIRTAVVVEDIPLTDMTKSTSPTGPLYSGNFPRVPDDVLSLRSRPSNISQVTRGRLEISISSAGMLSGAGAGVGVGRGHNSNGLKTGRSVHSVSSVDTVSKQIAARHRQHSHLAATANSPGSNIGSIYSQSHHQTLYQHTLCDASCIGIGDGGGMGTECGGMEDHLDQGVVLENSPIQVVRATVGTIDDTTLPCFTFRMWVLSTVFVVMGAAISEYNFFRSNSAYFSIYFVQLASYFCGKAMARWLPTREIEICVPGLNWVVSKWKSWWSSSSSSSSPLPPFQESMDESDFSINSNNSISSNNGRRAVGGQSHGGPIRPMDRGDLSRSNIASLKTDVKRDEGRISWRFTLNPGKFNMKEHMLIGIAAAAGCSPAYATNVLAIQSLVFNSPLGISTGVGLVLSSQCIGFSMAWLLFDYVIKPSVMIWPATLVNVSLYNTLHEHKVLTRWFTRMQLFWYAFFAIFIYQWLPRMFMPVLTSMALLCWIKPSSNILRKLGSGYTGLGIGSMSYPIVSSNLYDNTTQLYDVAMIVNKDLSFNLTMYEAYSPVVMTPYFAITYGTSFMAVVATFVHVALFYGSDIWLISSTRFSRKTQKLKEWAMGGLITRIFQGHGSTETNSSACKDTAEESGATAGGRTAAGYSPDLRPTSRKASGSLTFRNEASAGGGVDTVGMGTISGLSFEERVTGSGFHQSSHYRQLSQQQECFSLPLRQTSAFSTSRRSSKQLVDERDQIPTEMFGTEDIHTSLMRAYPEIPGWWFGIMFIVCFITAVFVCNAPEIRLPVYALVLALLLAAVFALPMAIIQALSSSQIGLNVLSEVVCGYLLPGNQLGNSVFKCYSYMALYQCLNLTQGFKLGHYMKVPPRQIFIAVVYGTILGAFVNLQVLEWVLLYNRQELFDADPKSGWSFRNLDLFFSASLLWGAISPKRLFAQGSIYHFLPYCFLLGILLPIPCYVMYRHYPPFGVVCKGDSRFWPFMPKCRCPPDYIAASQNGSAPATAVYPKPYLRQRRDEGGQIGLEEGRSRMGRAVAAAFKPGKSRRRLEQQLQQQQQQQEQQESMGQKTEPNDACYSSADERPSPSFDSALPSPHNGGIHTPTTPTTPVPFTPATATTAAPGFNDVVRSHIYYGNPESALEDRLRRFSWNLVNTPLICVGASFVPQAPASFVVSAGVVAFCFAYLVLRYRHEWWRRYTFVLAAALDSGTQICNMAIFVVFSLILKGAVEFPNWLGNDAINPEKCGVGDGYN